MSNLPKLVPFKKKDDLSILDDDKEYKKKILMLYEEHQKQLLEEEENKSQVEEEIEGNPNITQNYINEPKEWITTDKADDLIIDGLLIDEQQFNKEDAAKYREKKIAANKKKFNSKSDK
jgi:hypothetical protein